MQVENLILGKIDKFFKLYSTKDHIISKYQKIHEASKFLARMKFFLAYFELAI
jgi:hypothetical protein